MTHRYLAACVTGVAVLLLLASLPAAGQAQNLHDGVGRPGPPGHLDQRDDYAVATTPSV